MNVLKSVVVWVTLAAMILINAKMNSYLGKK
jgi:hypothetical protein